MFLSIPCMRSYAPTLGDRLRGLAASHDPLGCAFFATFADSWTLGPSVHSRTRGELRGSSLAYGPAGIRPLPFHSPSAPRDWASCVCRSSLLLGVRLAGGRDASLPRITTLTYREGMDVEDPAWPRLHKVRFHLTALRTPGTVRTMSASRRGPRRFSSRMPDVGLHGASPSALASEGCRPRGGRGPLAFAPLIACPTAPGLALRCLGCLRSLHLSRDSSFLIRHLFQRVNAAQRRSPGDRAAERSGSARFSLGDLPWRS